MPNLTKFVVLILLVTATACSSDSEYVESTCKMDGKDLLIVFQTLSNAQRTIALSSPDNRTVFFKGTTLADMKWIAGYSDFKEIVLASPEPESSIGQLTLTYNDGSKKILGWITSSCWQLMQAQTKGLVVTRKISGP